MELVLMTFIDETTGNEVHDCRCCVDQIDIMYHEGAEVIIAEKRYDIIKVIPCVNGHITYRIYIKEKSN